MEYHDIDTYIGYKDDHKTWSVNFLNENSLGLYEVKDIFKQFGALRVVQTKTSTGRCFVNFFTKEDARKCVEGMKNHETIALSLPKNYDPEPISLEEKMNKSQQHRLKIPHSFDNEWKNRKNDDRPEEDAFEVTSTTYIEGIKNEENNIGKNVTTTFPSRSSYPGPGSPAPAVHNATDTKIQQIIEEVPASAVSEFPAEIPSLFRDDIESVSQQGVLDSSISFSTLSTEPYQVIEAQEVIFANIPMEYGVCFILHLLEDYQPISVSSMKILPSWPVRYCHVYFTNLPAAESVEAAFDDIQLAQNRIIVLRADSLAQQAMIA